MMKLAPPIFLGALAGLFAATSASNRCNSIENGYNCNLPVAHLWGQYSPYFAVNSKVSEDIPEGCQVTFVQVLSRHGARFPTASKGSSYAKLIAQIHNNVQSYPGNYAFLQNYTYTLGADILTPFGQQELVQSGRKFYDRYKSLARTSTPFVRASGEDRVVVSAENFTQGFHLSKEADAKSGRDPYPYPILVIPEEPTYNNTLDHSVCTNFEDGVYDYIPDQADSDFLGTFIHTIQSRLNNDLVGANLSASQTLYMMDLCPFNTVASDNPTQLSEFCWLFSQDEWQSYNYYQSVDKYYNYGAGNPLGPSQGVGWANELISRLTDRPVKDQTSTNSTLDSSNKTFPLGKTLYADFSHDTQMTAIFTALGLYNRTKPLPTDHISSAGQSGGYSSAWATSFGARAYFEKMTCTGEKQELIRVIVNDRVIPLIGCGADRLGRCQLDSWLKTLTFPKDNGRWDLCFNTTSSSTMKRNWLF